MRVSKEVRYALRVLLKASGEGELWVPLRLNLSEQGGSWRLSGIGRLKPGVGIERAREDLARVHKAMISEREVRWRISCPPRGRRGWNRQRRCGTNSTGNRACARTDRIVCATAVGQTLCLPGLRQQ
jgi:hypothetical protein